MEKQVSERTKITVGCSNCSRKATRTLVPGQVFDAERNTIDGKIITCPACRLKVARDAKLKAGEHVKPRGGRMSVDSNKIHEDIMKNACPCRHLSKREIKELEGKYTPPVKAKPIAFVI